ncbi:hypothetical protein AB7Z36_16485 [Providencia rettgeri]
MNINDRVYVKTDGEERREGTILLIEPFNEGVMYLIALPDYPEGRRIQVRSATLSRLS